MNATRIKVGTAGLVALFGFTVLACPASLDDRCAEGACVAGGTQDGSSPTEGGPPPDPCVDTPNDPKCLDESTAFFVSAAAPAGGAGTKAAPFKTIGEALAKITPEKKRVYICAGDYPEQVTIETTVSLIGGFACSFSEAGPKPRIAPPKGVAVTIKGAQTVALASLEVDAKADPQKPNDSAVAVLASGARGLTLKDCDVSADRGTQGESGRSGTELSNYSGVTASKGSDNTGATGGVAVVCACTNKTTSTGGAGGTSEGASPKLGESSPVVPAPNANAGSSSAVSCGPGTAGKNAPAISLKATGATAPGKLTTAGWEVAAAKAGEAGTVGQGGGGGGSTSNPMVGGGSGGCGGCGGNGGGAGISGGSSFAVLSYGSSIRILGGALSASDAGSGGPGGKGERGQFRGAGGAGACSGGEGGHGAGGSGGGGGAGGHSAAVAHDGTSEVNVDASAQLRHGVAGKGGTGGTGGESSGNAGPDGENGADGSAKLVLSL